MENPDHVEDMTELFNRDPVGITVEDTDKIIAVLQSKRHTFLALPAGATKKKAPTTPAAIAASKLDLGDFKL